MRERHKKRSERDARPASERVDVRALTLELASANETVLYISALKK